MTWMSSCSCSPTQQIICRDIGGRSMCTATLVLAQTADIPAQPFHPTRGCSRSTRLPSASVHKTGAESIFKVVTKPGHSPALIAAVRVDELSRK